MSQEQAANKLTYYMPDTYRSRGFFCLIFLVLTVITQLFSFSQNIGLFFALIVYFWGGGLFVIGAVKELLRLYIGFNAFLSFWGFIIVWFGIFGILQGNTSNNNWVFAELAFTLMFANFIKAKDVGYLKSSFKFVESLDNFISPSCILVTSEGYKKVFCEEIKIGNIILLKNSHRLAFDGEIVKGSTLFDENLLTGNITLASKQVGDKVLAGSINKGKDVEIKVLSSKKTSHIAGVLDAVKQSENRKLVKISNLERPALVFLIITFLIATVLGLISVYKCSDNNYHTYVLSSICLCMMMISPVSYMFSVILPWHYLSKVTCKGKIKINDVTVLERVNDSSKVFIDKTGTLTTGHLQVAEIMPAKGVDEETLMKAALSTQQNAQNIFAFALKEWGIKNKMVPLKISSLELHPSYGALVRSGEDTYLAGRRTWLESKGIEVPMPEEEVRKTVFYVAKNTTFLGCIYFTDRLRANAAATVKYLLGLNKRVCLLSGDNTLAISAAARRAGIKEYYGNMYPTDKSAKINADQNVGETITMIGDGFNDILALLQADASLAFVPTNNLFTSWVDVIIKGKDFTLVKRIFELYDKGKFAVRLNLLLSILISLFCYSFVLNNTADICLVICGFFVLNIFLIFLNSLRLKYE
ncbi:MAG: HAD-IC family P-type ATPase [Elusimicrobiaceae bacterium]|nr:HAD-IC family P-type ATPase [Elusimicrobiaceae bacterium]